VEDVNKDFSLQMRIDKYLWSTRYFKTRNMGTTACKKGHVKINGIVRKNQINYQLTVLDIPKSRVGAKLVDIYRMDTTPKEEFEHNDLLQYSKDHYRKKGEGRPTKKERREIDEYLEDSDADWD